MHRVFKRIFFSFFFLQTETDAKDIFPYGNLKNGAVIALFFFLQTSNAYSNYITMGCQITVVYEAIKSLLQLITICSSTNEVTLFFLSSLRTRFRPLQ